MNRVRFLLLLILIIKSNLIIYGQLSAEENQKAHKRYWFYRTRMINDFMKIGRNQGDCIVFPQRNYLNVPAGNDAIHAAKVGPDQIDITNQYLTALALEYQILSRSNQSTQETLKEIFYILYTINRLDAEADQFWTQFVCSNCQNISANVNDLNGFMLREDMPRDYISNNIQHFNYCLKENPNNNAGFTGIEYVDHLSWDNHFSNWNGYSLVDPSAQANLGRERMTLPHDKYYSMFIAFMALIKYLPDNLYYYENGVPQAFQDGTYDLKTEIRNITNRCHSYLKGQTFGSPITDWTLEYPDATNLVHLGDPKPYSYALAKIICNINSDYPWPNHPSCIGYQDPFSSTAGLTAFNTLQGISFALGDDGAVFLANSQAGSNTTYFVPPMLFVPEWIAMDLNCSVNSVEWAELLRIVLHEDDFLMKQLSVYSSPITTAPCDGPLNYGLGNFYEWEWSSQDRLEHPSKRGQYNLPTGRYPGVDYMLLHNLYYERLNQLDDAEDPDGETYNAYNLMDNYDESIWPVHFNIGGFDILAGVNDYYNSNNTLRFPGEVKLFQNLNSTAQIYATSSPSAPSNYIQSKVEYRAGKEINLQPGFFVQAGSDFHAYIQRYTCSVGDANGSYQRTTANHNSSYEADSMNTIVPIHHVDYPKKNKKVNLGSGNIDTKFLDSEKFLQISPNPGRGVYNVVCNMKEEFDIRVFSLQGELIKIFEKITSETKVDITEVDPGMYLFVLNSASGQSKTVKIVKE